MGATFSRVHIIGYLGSDPRQHVFQDGSTVTNLSIAVTDRWKDAKNEVQERTNWIGVAVFNPSLAEVANKYLKKGSYVSIEGELQSRPVSPTSKLHETIVVMRPYNSSLRMLDKKPVEEDRYPDQEEAEADRPAQGQQHRAAPEPRR